MVHIRRCSAGIRQQFLVAEWLGLRITVRVRVRARAREWNPFLFLFVCFFVCLSVNVVDIIVLHCL